MGGLFGGPTLAAKPTYGLVLFEDRSFEFDPYGTRPDYCINEDDQHERRWGSSMAVGEELTATEQFCDPYLDGQSGGNTSLYLVLRGKGERPSGTITTPSGEVRPALPIYPQSGAWFSLGACVAGVYDTVRQRAVASIPGGVYTAHVVNDSGRPVREVTVSLLALHTR